MRNPILFALATALPLAFGTSTAAAEDFCVAKPRCIGTAITAAQLPTRLFEAGSNGTADRFFLGATTFANGPYTYSSDERMELIGASGGGSILQSGVVNRTILTLVGSAASVTGVHVEVAIDTGVAVTLSGATAHDLTLTHLLGTQAGGGVLLNDGATLADSHISMTGDFALGVVSSIGSATIVGSTISSNNGAVAASSPSGELTVARSILHAPLGAEALGSRLTVTDTLVDGRGATSTSFGLASIAQGPVTAELHARRTTVVGWNTTSGGAIGAYSAAEAGGTSTAEISDSAFVDVGTAFLRSASPGGVANLTARWNAHADPLEVIDEGAGTLTESDRLPEPTGFVDAANGDFRLLADSPLVDAGDPDADLVNAVVDLDGAPRLADGNGDCVPRLDVGAFERQPSGPCTPADAGRAGETPGGPSDGPGGPSGGPGGGPGGPGGSGPTGDHVKPILSALHVPARLTRSKRLPKLGASRRAPAIAFRLSERAKVTLRFARRGRGGRYRTLHSSLRVSARAGASRLGFGGQLTRRARLAAGRYRVTLTARDAAGNSSRPLTVAFRIG
ncbi:MAG TPA: hypothetical protein VGM91_02075 [Conexibacter sp.]|jgi:hypothetical protein